MSDFNSSLPVRTELPGDVIVKIADATTTTQQLAVNVDGSVNAVVTATNLDIRDLTPAQDKVAIGDGTDTLAINADGSINSVVTATNLDIRDLAFATDKVDVSGSSVSITGSVTVTATDLDIRNLSATQDNVAISDGTDTLAINTDGSINVNIVSATAGTSINNYNTAANVSGGATSNHDYTVTAGKTLMLNQIEASASGKMKIEVQIESGVSTNTFTTRFVQFNSTATPIMSIKLNNAISVAAGVRVRVIRTNKEGSSQDLYSTISGIEN
jgi:hypothetical protein